MNSYISNKNNKTSRKSVYTKMKPFHFKDKLNSLPAYVDKIMAPVHVRVKPTNVCTHNCWYCSYKADNMQLGKDMKKRDYIPEAKMMEIIDDLVDMKVKAVTFSGGGDPFYYPYLLKAVEKLCKTSIRFAALTNGARLEGGLAQVFAHHGTWLRISIDGWDDKSYSSYRDVPEGEFTKVMKNMEDFKKLKGKCVLGVSLIVDKRNASHIYQFIGRLKRMGVNSVKVSPCVTSDDDAINNLYHKPILQKVKEGIRKAMSDFADEEFEINDSYHQLENTFEKKYTWCPYLQILPVIGADLNIYPCQDKAYNLDEGLLGSIENRRFKDFWFSDKNKFFKIDPSVHCNHHCVADAKNKMVIDYLDADREHLVFV